MKKLLIILFIILIPLAATAQLQGSKYNIFIDAFNEPIEIIYFVFYNGDVHRFTTHDENEVAISVPVMVDTIKRDGNKISNVAIIIHNHWARPYFSDSDKRTYTYLKGKGFKGRFLLYVLPQRIIREWDGKTTKTIKE